MSAPSAPSCAKGSARATSNRYVTAGVNTECLLLTPLLFFACSSTFVGYARIPGLRD